MFRCSDEVLRVMTDRAVALETANLTCNTGNFVLARSEKTRSRELSVVIQKFENNGGVFGIYVTCNDTAMCEILWHNWVYTESQDPQELYEKLKILRDNVSEDEL